MQIEVQARHGSLGEAARQKIAEKVEKLGRFIERVTNIDVIVDLDKADQPIVEIAVVTEFKKDFRADYQSGDLYGCVDQAMDKLEQQIRKYKEKLVDHR